MKQFNLEEYLKNPSKKVVTRDGRSVRIVCTDRKSKQNFPIIALIECFDGDEDFLCYPRDGKWPSCKNVDLFFAPEKHEGWINVYRDRDTGTVSFGAILYTSREEAEEVGKTDVYYAATAKIEWEE